ncbi:MAG: bifunctional diguanylate cyclase/phosphodiesterase, partial [Hyphomicrobiales bacterium]
AENQRCFSEAERPKLLAHSGQFERDEELAQVGGWAFDLTSEAVTWSDELYRICEIPFGTPMTRARVLSIFPETSRAVFSALVERAIRHGGGFNQEIEIATVAGTQKWVRIAGDVDGVDGVPVRLFGILQDISEQHASEQALWHTAHHDALTGLANRAYAALNLTRIFSRRDAVSAAAIESGEAIGMLMIDVDRLKEVNDTLGHDAGDVLLRTVATRITGAVGEDCLVARIGGDEFKVMFERPVSPRRLEATSQAIHAAMQEKLRFEDQVITPQVSIGGAIASVSDTPETLRQKADLALYESKRRGRGGYAEFRDDMRAAIVRRTATMRKVDEALAEGRIVPFYQPIVRLDTCRLTGVEALARMIGPDGTVVSAVDFQEALADPRIGHDLTSAMLPQVAADIRRWFDAGLTIDHVGINIAATDFQVGDLRSRLMDAFGQHDVPLGKVLLEVTETIFLDDKHAAVVQTVDDLRRDGLRVALDDFGTGYASLTHLRSLPVDVIKIDKSFVHGMLTDRASGPIVEALIDLARKLRLDVIAEGIEDLAEAEHLRGLGCPLGQGYFFARPANATFTAIMLDGFGVRGGESAGQAPGRACGTRG